MGLFLAENDLAKSFMIKGICEFPFDFLGGKVYITTTATYRHPKLYRDGN